MRTTYSRGAIVVALVTGAVLDSAAPVRAQEAGQLTEIVVTARKRQESIMKVPVVATAVGEEQLERFQTNDLKSLATMVPGLSLGSSILSVGVQASLRGVGTSALDPGVDSSVALNIDGLTLSQGLAFASGMFDVGQIEVLKGPQSLFYGKSAPGGVISLRSNDPTDKFELIARTGYEFEAREWRGDAIISGPVTETIKLRLAGSVGEQEGFYTNNAQAIPELGARNPAKRRMTPAEDYKIRGTVLWNPSDAFDARLKVNHVYDDTLYAGTGQNLFCPDGVGPFNGRQFVSTDCTSDRNIPLVDLDPAAFPGIPNDGTPFNTTRQSFGTLELNYRPSSELTVSSTTGYYLAKSRSMLNATMSSAGAGIISAINRFERDQLTEELRLTSDFAGPVNFMVGGFIERGEFYDLVTIGGNTRLGMPPVLQKGKKTVDIETDSVFAQILYRIVPELEIAAGARWSDETRTVKGVNLITATPQPVALAVPEINADNIAPELTVTYTPTDDLTLFGAAKRGYKSGSFNVSTPPFTGENNSFGDEKVEGGELGLKSRLLDRSLALNLAGYYYEYSGLQVGANVTNTSGVPVTRTVNAGRARNYGVEAEANYQPPSLAELGLHGSVNWNDGRYTELANVPCYGGQTIAEGCNLLFNPLLLGGVGAFTSQDRSGAPLIRAPKWQANFGFDYEVAIGGELELVFASNTQYSSEYLTNLGYLFYQGDFIKTDASVTLRGAQQKWEVALIGKNLNNELTTGNCSNGNRNAGQSGGLLTGTNSRGPAGIDETSCYMDRGREVWVRFTFRPFE